MMPARATAEPLLAMARSTSRSHVGRVRQINEDRVLDAPERQLWAVSDGMGGHRGGDLAAQSVIDALRRVADADAPIAPAAIIAALDRANAEIFARDRETGATVVVLSFHGDRAHVAWAGDSRCYRIRDGVACQLTRDHSLVQELTDAGLITADAAAAHPQANVITRAVGVGEACAFDSLQVDLRPGDRFLLCSDGLSRTLRLADLADTVLDPLADRLLEQALFRDGSDNISLVLVDHHSPSQGVLGT